MGQVQSTESHGTRAHEEIAKELVKSLYRATANKFAEKCFTSFELYLLKDVFRSLADQEGEVRYLKEETMARFLELPDILHISPVVFQMVSFIGAFPFLDDAPAVLGLEQMVMVITLVTERHRHVLAKSGSDRTKLLFKSLAVYDRQLSEVKRTKRNEGVENGRIQTTDEEAAAIVADGGPVTSQTRTSDFSVDAAGEEDSDECQDGEDDDDSLVLAAFSSLDYVDVFKQGSVSTIDGAMIPTDNFRRLIMLLLLAAPLGAQEGLSSYSDRLAGDELESLRTTAEAVLTSFLDVETAPGIMYNHFSTIIPACMPHLFQGLGPLFERFLFSKPMDLNRRKDNKPRAETPSPYLNQPFLHETGCILNRNVLSQLSLFVPGPEVFRRLRLLYSGDRDGFSMASFESKVFNWRAPTILLVRGTRLATNGVASYDSGSTASESAFAAMLPSNRFPAGSKDQSDDSEERLTFGLHVLEPWKHTLRECFGNSSTTLFQLEPVHDVFRASSLNCNYVSFIKPSSTENLLAGIAMGCRPPTAGHQKYKSGAQVIALGAVSLVMDSGFQFGCFHHEYSSQGGAFASSVWRKFNFQDRFEIESLEVWGCGGDDEAKCQAERWAWESREAEARRRINLGTGDIESDRALLEMAGLVGDGNLSGGSMA